MHSGTLVAFGKHSEDGRGVYRIGSRRELRDAWRTRMTSGKMVLGSALGNVEGGFRYVRHFSKESFGLTFGTRGVFRRKDRRVWFEGVSKGAFGEKASGWLPGQVALSEGRSGRGFGGTSKGGIRQGFGKGEGSFEDTRHAPKGCLRRGYREGLPD